jgi:hypothetical protein
MQQRGGVRKSLIHSTWQSILIAYAQQKYYTTANLLKTISHFLGVKLPDLPYAGPYNTKFDFNYIKYCERNLPEVSRLVDEWLAKHSDRDSVWVVEND